MQLDFLSAPVPPSARPVAVVRVGDREVPVHFVRNHRARRYILRLRPDGSVRATVPRAGTILEARAFAERSASWIARQLLRRAQQPPPTRTWGPGTEFLYRGEKVLLNVAGQVVQFADQTLPMPGTGDLRLAVERHLWRLAVAELTARTTELANAHRIVVHRITVRSQRSRWGSCSHRGTVSLNWRLIQTPAFVRDYIILHELLHRREMNHSARFWRLVAEHCPRYEEAERWLKNHRGLLR